MPRIIDRPNCAEPWTPEDLELVAAGLKAGRTIPELARAMGRSQEAIRAKAWKAGLLPPRKKKGPSLASRNETGPAVTGWECPSSPVVDH